MKADITLLNPDGNDSALDHLYAEYQEMAGKLPVIVALGNGDL